MEYKDRIIKRFAECTCDDISEKVIKSLQNMKENLLSGDDTPLENVWDEICIQIQHQYSIYWDTYLITIESLIKDEIKKLGTEEKEAIWMQTENGIDWQIEIELEETKGQRVVDYLKEDIINYILYDHILEKASDWTISE